MSRLIVAVVWIWSSMCSVTYGFEFFDTETEEYVTRMQTQCELRGRTTCEELYRESRERILPVLDFVKNAVEGENLYERATMRESLPGVIAYLEKKRDAVLTEKKKIMIEYLLVGFQDIVIEQDYKDSGMRVSAEDLALLEKNLLGKSMIDPIRQSLIKQLMAKGFDEFATHPYSNSLNVLQTEHTDRRQWKLTKNILQNDALDSTIHEFIEDESNAGKDLRISKEDYESRTGIYLFKNASDLQNVGYRVVSHRTRVNTDAEYRRYNIAKAFEEIGNVRVLNPGETISYLGDSNFDMVEQQRYRSGTAIFLDEEVEAYGGGLCGGSTAIYQGTFLNRSLAFTKRNHSKRYTSLYTATINGENQSMPGIDSTIYSPNLDLKVTNTASYPIILVMNYDGEYATTEEIFTMSPNLGDEGSYRFVQSWARGYTLNTADGEGRAVTGGCYEWEINDELSTRCYKEVF